MVLFYSNNYVIVCSHDSSFVINGVSFFELLYTSLYTYNMCYNCYISKFSYFMTNKLVTYKHYDLLRELVFTINFC